MEVLLFLAAAGLLYLWAKKGQLERSASALEQQLKSAQSALERAQEAHAEATVVLRRAHGEQVAQLQAELDALSKFRNILDAEAEALRVRQVAETERQTAAAEISSMRSQAAADARERRDKAEALVSSAHQQAAQLIADAKRQAEEIAGDAYRALREVDQLKEAATAMRNVIEGYGDRYLKPTFSILDELAEAYGFDEAGKQLKLARERTKSLVEAGRAATCDYVEAHRRRQAIQFVEDAFNGKVDSILSRTKSDNHGTLERQIRDAWALVNLNGAAFRNARVTEEYLQARIDELRWATATMAIKEREKEEQRAIKEQLREEERARREIERALKEAAKEEESLQKAMEKVRDQVARANEEQRAKYEAELQLLQERLAEAEQRNQRALSMAQQTKAGHVYVISNVGSFGENVYKIGMTRRLEPMDRIRELGDASVPFPFDVHAMIWTDDAPGLEAALHKEFVRAQINKVNPRKEFFGVDLTSIRRRVEQRGLEVSWTLAAAAAEYRESLAIEQRMQADPELADAWMRQQAAAETDMAVPSEAEGELATLSH